MRFNMQPGYVRTVSASYPVCMQMPFSVITYLLYVISNMKFMITVTFVRNRRVRHSIIMCLKLLFTVGCKDKGTASAEWYKTRAITQQQQLSTWWGWFCTTSCSHTMSCVHSRNHPVLVNHLVSNSLFDNFASSIPLLRRLQHCVFLTTVISWKRSPSSWSA